MRRGHAVAAGTGFGTPPSGKILPMAELAGDQAPAVRPRGQLGPRAVNGHRAPRRNGPVMAEGGRAGRNIAARGGDGKLMALGAGIQPGDGAAGMAADPTGGVVVLGKVRRRGARTAPATATTEEGQRKREGETK